MYTAVKAYFARVTCSNYNPKPATDGRCMHRCACRVKKIQGAFIDHGK
jgi:hypothetical protein